MAKYYNVLADYLLGLADNPTTDPLFRHFLECTELNEEAYSILITGGILKRTSKKFNIYNKHRIRIRNWIISSGYLNKIASLLDTIEKTSKDIVKGCKEKSIEQSDIFLMCEAADYSKFKNFDEINKKNILCDMNKYFLIKIVEGMANHFDQRENKGLRQLPKIKHKRLWRT